jgi:hypothetical protein
MCIAHWDSDWLCHVAVPQPLVQVVEHLELEWVLTALALAELVVAAVAEHRLI